VPRLDVDSCEQILAFRRFRLNVIRFLRLSLAVNEQELRDAIRTASPVLHAIYQGRAARVQSLMRGAPGVPGAPGTPGAPGAPGAPGFQHSVSAADPASNWPAPSRVGAHDTAGK
jgi:hypothetical protein